MIFCFVCFIFSHIQKLAFIYFAVVVVVALRFSATVLHFSLSFIWCFLLCIFYFNLFHFLFYFLTIIKNQIGELTKTPHLRTGTFGRQDGWLFSWSLSLSHHCEYEARKNKTSFLAVLSVFGSRFNEINVMQCVFSFKHNKWFSNFKDSVKRRCQ